MKKLSKWLSFDILLALFAMALPLAAQADAMAPSGVPGTLYFVCQPTRQDSAIGKLAMELSGKVVRVGGMLGQYDESGHFDQFARYIVVEGDHSLTDGHSWVTQINVTRNALLGEDGQLSLEFRSDRNYQWIERFSCELNAASEQDTDLSDVSVSPFPGETGPSSVTASSNQ